jgi:Xaa-Pro aminopeptidase
MEKLRISVEEHKSRQTKLLEELDRRNLKGACLFGNTAIKYLTGFNFIPTERPMAFVLTKDEAVMFVPKLEEKHCLIGTALDRSVSYPEYPGERHSIYTLKDLLVEMNLDNKKIGVDAGGYPHIFGYEGPSS